MKTPKSPVQNRALRRFFSFGGRRPDGFALISVMLMMVLLLVLGVGLMSLGAIGLRTTQTSTASQIAKANARLALAMALNELQVHLGDDRRITADASILGESVGQPHLVGVWDSFGTEGTDLLRDVETSGPRYNQLKGANFRRWLVSSDKIRDASNQQFAQSMVVNNGVELFSEDLDGFSLEAERVAVKPADGASGSNGSYAWAISQAATKAGISVGTDQPRIRENDSLVAPTRPTLTLSQIAQDPTSGWDSRSSKIVSLQQAALDPEYGLDRLTVAQLGREHTARSLGVIADVVNGGLKTDMSLGFELSDSRFNQSSWDGIRNPFAQGGAANSSYETPLFNGVGNGTIQFTVNYSPVIIDYRLDAGAAPTFDAFRSFYRLSRHMYLTQGQPTAFTRFQTNPGYTVTEKPRNSETALQPVLDRALFYLSYTLDTDNGDSRRGYPLAMQFTPVITLWNPYNVAIESEGYVVYPWMDIPLFVTHVKNNGGNSGGDSLSKFMGRGAGFGWTDSGHGRMGEPYFLCKLTADGVDHGGSISRPLRLGPGEVVTFVPGSTSPTVLPLPQSSERFEDRLRSVFMRPLGTNEVPTTKGGIKVRLTQSTNQQITPINMLKGDTIRGTVTFTRNQHYYFLTLEDATRIKQPTLNAYMPGRKEPLRITPISEVEIHLGQRLAQSVTSPTYTGSQLESEPQILAVMETFHRTGIAHDQQPSDLVYTVNPRQKYTNTMISGAQALPNSHYDSSLRAASRIETTLQTNEGLAYYGLNNSAGGGRNRLAFFEVPREPLLSLGQFQHADFTDSAFAPASQVGNAWASPFIPIDRAVIVQKNTTTDRREPIFPTGLGMYDTSYLLNTALWDSFYFSSIAPEFELSSGQGSPSIYDSERTRETRSMGNVISAWVKDPVNSPLRNPRHILHRGGLSDSEITNRLSSPAGCRYAAGHMLVDGSFNVNSTNIKAWAAVLGSLRGSRFDVEALKLGSTSNHNSRDLTPFSRMRRPMGDSNDLWTGFRELTDTQIEGLAKEIVDEVRKRGPFLSLGEFVNRRIEKGEFGEKGALQAAIDRTGLNKDAQIDKFNPLGYPHRTNITDPYIGTGIPGWLTQADLLTALGPVMSVRSDTFTIRAYGEAKDKKGNVTSRAWCEAVVQRVPEWVDPSDEISELPANASETNQIFGRRFEIVSFREVSKDELDTFEAKRNS